MAEALSVAHVIRIAEAGEPFTLNGSDAAISDLVAIAAAASRARNYVKFRGLDGRPLEDLMRITVAGRGHVIFVADEAPRPNQPVPRRNWFGMRPKAANGVRVAGKGRAEVVRPLARAGRDTTVAFGG